MTDFLKDFGDYAAKQGEQWRLDNPELMDAYQAHTEKPSTTVGAIAQLNSIVDAWEALPGGRQVRNSDVEAWLGRYMGPAIDAIRGFLRRPRPDGVIPRAPETSE